MLQSREGSPGRGRPAEVSLALMLHSLGIAAIVRAAAAVVGENEGEGGSHDGGGRVRRPEERQPVFPRQHARAILPLLPHRPVLGRAAGDDAETTLGHLASLAYLDRAGGGPMVNRGASSEDERHTCALVYEIIQVAARGGKDPKRAVPKKSVQFF